MDRVRGNHAVASVPVVVAVVLVKVVAQVEVQPRLSLPMDLATLHTAPGPLDQVMVRAIQAMAWGSILLPDPMLHSHIVRAHGDQ